MRNETARREIESLDYYLQNHTDDYGEESHMAMMMAIKVLKEPVLDRIRAEIVERQKEYHEYGWAYDDALEIIDKYRKERTDADSD